MTKEDHIKLQIGALEAELKATQETIDEIKGQSERIKTSLANGMLVLANDRLRLKRAIEYWKQQLQ